MSKKPILTVAAWSAGAVSLAGFAAAWVLAFRNARPGPTCSARLLGVVDQVLAPAHLSLWLREPGSFG